MKSPRIRLFLLPLMAAGILFAGCSKDSTNKPRPDPFGQTDADDIAQQLAASLATDPGGWLYEITRSMAQRTASGDTAATAVQSGMTHVLSFVYTDSLNNPRTAWDALVSDVDGFNRATGTLNAPGVAGTYGHLSDFLVTGANRDTAIFSTLALDTTLCAIQSPFRADSARWYITTFYDYDEVKMFRDNVAEPWPHAGFVSWLIEAHQLNSMDPADINRTLLVDATLTFNGTELVPATVFEFEDDPRTHFHYWVNLKNGTITRR